MACAAAKKQGTISEGFYFDDDFFLWKYAFTFSDQSAVIKFLEITSEGKSIQDAANAAGVEIECDADEKVVKAKSYGDRKATVITISEKLPCVEDWYKIAKSYDGKADVTCRALAEETGEKYFNYRYIGDGNKGQPALVQGNVKESKEMEEEEKELIDINNLKVEKDYIDDNGKIPIEESRKPKDKRVYAEIYSYGIPSHITWFDNLKTAKRELENHIASMTKVGDYEIFRDEKAADVKMQEGDFEITLYVPSGSEDVVDNDVEHVIIRPKKEQTVKEEINNMEKHLKTDVTPVMNKIKVYGFDSTHPSDKSDFWFYIYDESVDKYNAYHVYAGTGDNLSIEDEKQGFVDCITYDSYKDVHSNDSVLPLNAIVSYISGDDDTLSNFYDDSRMIPLYNPYINLTVKQICWKVLNKDGVPHPENLTAYIVYTYYDVWD